MSNNHLHVVIKDRFSKVILDEVYSSIHKFIQDKNIIVHDGIGELEAIAYTLQGEYPDGFVYCELDRHNFCSLPALNMLIDEAAVENDEMYFQQYMAKWYPMKDDTKTALDEELKVLEAEAFMNMSAEDYDPWYEDEIELDDEL